MIYYVFNTTNYIGPKVYVGALFVTMGGYDLDILVCILTFNVRNLLVLSVVIIVHACQFSTNICSGIHVVVA